MKRPYKIMLALTYGALSASKVGIDPLALLRKNQKDLDEDYRAQETLFEERQKKLYKQRLELARTSSDQLAYQSGISTPEGRNFFARLRAISGSH